MRTRRFVLSAIVAGLLVVIAPGNPAADPGPDAPRRLNHRAFFAAGFTARTTPAGVRERGLGLDAGFEAEGWKRFSLVGRFEGTVLPAYQPLPIAGLSGAQWSLGFSVGGRFYPAPSAGVRPYSEATIGLRTVESPTGPLHADADGMCLTLRLGIATNTAGRTGAFLDAGYQCIAGEYDRPAFVPIRFGLTF